MSWMERKSNEEVLRIFDELRTLLNTIDAKTGQMTIYLIRHDRFFETLLKGKIEGKSGRGQPSQSNIHGSTKGIS